MSIKFLVCSSPSERSYPTVGIKFLKTRSWSPSTWRTSVQQQTQTHSETMGTETQDQAEDQHEDKGNSRFNLDRPSTVKLQIRSLLDNWLYSTHLQ